MTDQRDIEEIADEILEEYDQSEDFKDRFMNFYENTVENNLGGTSLERLIDNVELSEEEELDGS
ncbi:MAG: CxC ATPase DNA modification system associated small protein [Gammaproteobacteria bacterium]|nr:CxC ATPase DNA modification system associated small protein [Gammaproteobacteria bacterium]